MSHLEQDSPTESTIRSRDRRRRGAAVNRTDSVCQRMPIGRPSHIHRTRECDGTVENAKYREGKVAFYLGFRRFALISATP